MTDNAVATRIEVSGAELVKQKTLVGKVSTRRISRLERLGNIQGTKLVKVQQGARAAEDVVCSNLDIRLLGYMIRHSSSYNMVIKIGTDKPATTEYLAKKFNTTPQKIRRFLKKCVDHDVVCRSKKALFMNPYTYIPYSKRRDAAENDQVVYQMQQWWRGNTSEPPEIVTASLAELEKAEQSLETSEISDSKFNVVTVKRFSDEDQKQDNVLM